MKSDNERAIWISLFLLSSATLVFEINLTRLFSVAQFYHFAFMIVSIALLGFGASGTALTLSSSIRKGDTAQRLCQLALATGLSIMLAYLLINWLPFDSFSIAWDSRQIWILILHYVTLASPFFFSGMALGFLLNAFPQAAGRTYAVNLLGSAAGCILALAAPAWLGGERMVTLSIGLAALAGIVSQRRRRTLTLVSGALLACALLDLGWLLAGGAPVQALVLRISPYKSLSYALQSPGTQLIYRKWNAFSRIDVVRSGSLHSLPGLSYRYLGPLPAMDGLLVDGDDLSPVLQAREDGGFFAYLPAAAAFYIRPQANVLVLEPRGGLDVLTALALSTGQVTAVEINPLIVEAAPVYADSRLEVFVEADRSYVRRTQTRFDVVLLSLAASFHPVRSGAYTLAEDYRYTVEAVQEILAHLNPGGLLVATRWLQDPPSEDLRLFALGVTALENAGAQAHMQIVAFRGFNTTTLLIKNGAFTQDELTALRGFLAERAFDLSYAPGIDPAETNLYNILPASIYYQAYTSLLASQPREEFYRVYAYDVRPPTDDHPFFGHYFKWEQAPQILAEFGRAWQPFGGAGYFVVVALLGLAVVLAAALILVPVAVGKRVGQKAASLFHLYHLFYFGLLGLAFLFVEIPLLQRFILYLGHPAYAVTTVLFSLLFFSGLGSRWNEHVPLQGALAVLVVLILAAPSLLSRLFGWTLGLPLAARFGLSVISLAPLGLLMGVPFPAGIRWMQLHAEHSEAYEGSIPWIWAVNGAASVVSSILAALLALTFGFSWVLRLGALCYAGALTVWGMSRRGAARPRAR